MALINNKQIHALQAIEKALKFNDLHAVEDIIHTIGLIDILGDDVLTAMRARNKVPLVIFLATLAQSNDINSERATHWLDIYQSLQSQSPRGFLDMVDTNHIIRRIISYLSDTTDSVAFQDFGALTGSHQDWADGFELLIDAREWERANELLGFLFGEPGQEKAVLLCARALMVRHSDWITFSDAGAAGVDHAIVANMFNTASELANRLNQPAVTNDLKRMRARSLELSGEYEEAIQILKTIEAKETTLPVEVALSRCYAKSGQLLMSINVLDQLIPKYASMVIEHASFDQLLNDLIDSEPDTDAQAHSNDFDSDEVRIALVDLAQTLQKVNQKPFLVSGTLLGYVREGKLLSHDKDIDVGILGWESQFEVMQALLQSGKFFTEARSLRASDLYYLPVKHLQTNTSMDIFFYQEKDGKYITGVDFNFGHRQTFSFSSFNLRLVSFLGASIYIPDNAELNLSENYGNWHVSDPNYIAHLESPSTLDKGGLAHQLTARLSIMQALQDRKSQKLLKIAAVMDSYCDLPGGMDVESRNKLRLWATKIAN